MQCSRAAAARQSAEGIRAECFRQANEAAASSAIAAIPIVQGGWAFDREGDQPFGAQLINLTRVIDDDEGRDKISH